MIAHTAPFGRHLGWLAAGFETFDGAPGTWARLTAILAAVTVFFYSAPVVGPLLATAYLPLLLASLLAACEDLAAGEPVSLNPVVVLGRAGGGTLLFLAALHAALVSGLGAALDGLAAHAAATTDGVSLWLPSGPAWLVPATWAALLLAEWVMAYAVAAATLAGARPLTALSFGLRATLRNLHTLLVLGAVLTLLLFLGVVAFVVGLLIAVPTAAGVVYASLADLTDLSA